jgi:hypothetical protein
VLLRQVELALLLKTRASVVLTQGLELGPLLGELLRETALRRNGAGPSGLLVLRAGRRRGGNLTSLEASWRRFSCGFSFLCLQKAVFVARRCVRSLRELIFKDGRPSRLQRGWMRPCEARAALTFSHRSLN